MSGYYNTGQNFNVSTLYRSPSTVSNISSVCSRNNGIVLQTDSITRQASTVVVPLMSNVIFGLEDCVNIKQSLQNIDYMQNPKNISTVNKSNQTIIPDIFYSITDPILTTNPIVTNGSVFVGRCMVNNMITTNTATFVVSNYLSSYNIFSDDGLGVI